MAESIIAFYAAITPYAFIAMALMFVMVFVYGCIVAIARRVGRWIWDRIRAAPPPLSIFAAVVVVGGCASSGRPWTEHKITLEPNQTIELSSYETRLYRCPGDDMTLACRTIGGGGRVGYVRCGCALSRTVETLR